MGSDTDLEHLQDTIATLKEFGVSFEARVLSAHRSPHQLAEYVAKADKEGAKAYIAAAGGAAHLGGVIASLTVRPVLAVPIPSALNGLDSLLSMVQMPGGVWLGTISPVFQRPTLERTSTRAIVASAMCRASARIRAPIAPSSM